MRTRQICECGAAAIGHGLCSKHYQQKRYADNPKIKAYFQDRYEKQKERILAMNAEWRANNQDKIKGYHYAIPQAQHNARLREWAKNNKEKRRAIANRWVRKHPDKANAQTAKRRAKKLKATPQWANAFFIREAYHLAKLRTKVTGFKWHVDHIVPLRSKVVCGLHVENNLRVVPALLNAQKGNRHWPDMP